MVVKVIFTKKSSKNHRTLTFLSPVSHSSFFLCMRSGGHNRKTKKKKSSFKLCCHKFFFFSGYETGAFFFWRFYTFLQKRLYFYYGHNIVGKTSTFFFLLLLHNFFYLFTKRALPSTRKNAKLGYKKLMHLNVSLCVSFSHEIELRLGSKWHDFKSAFFYSSFILGFIKKDFASFSSEKEKLKRSFFFLS